MTSYLLNLLFIFVFPVSRDRRGFRYWIWSRFS